jgi:hypothetical protein
VQEIIPSAFGKRSSLSEMDCLLLRSISMRLVGGGTACPVPQGAGATGGRWYRAEPDHDTGLPGKSVPQGGALGWPGRWKVSMMTMWPPQHGHGGRVSGASVMGPSVAGGATASSSRTRARLVLRVELVVGAVWLAQAPPFRWCVLDLVRPSSEPHRLRTVPTIHRASQSRSYAPDYECES